MSSLGFFGLGNWLTILPVILFVACFYFTLTFFEHLRKGDDRLAKQSKLTATICLALALLIPALYSLYISVQMMK